MVLGVQRPVDISRFSLSETKHLFIFQTEGRDLKFSLRDSTTDQIVPAVRSLKQYQFVYYNRENGQIAIGDAKQLHNVFVSTYKPQPVDSDTGGGQDQGKGTAARGVIGMRRSVP
jgi:hypothetical protein